MRTNDITAKLSAHLDFPYKFRGQVYNTPKTVVEISTVWTNDSLTVVRREDTKEVYVIHKEQGVLAPEEVVAVDIVEPNPFDDIPF